MTTHTLSPTAWLRQDRKPVNWIAQGRTPREAALWLAEMAGDLDRDRLALQISPSPNPEPKKTKR